MPPLKHTTCQNVIISLSNYPIVLSNKSVCIHFIRVFLTLLFVHCFLAIPALQPIVHDLFVLRGSNKADAGKELETQKEVVVSMLLRLIQHHQVTLYSRVHC